MESAIKVQEAKELPNKLMEQLLQDKEIKEMIMNKIASNNIFSNGFGKLELD